MTSTEKIMNPTLESTYCTVKKLEQSFRASDDENKRQEIRQEVGKVINDLIAGDDTLRLVWREYKESINNGNEYINFPELIKKRQVEDYVECMQKQGLTHFTVSSTWSNAVEIAWCFQQEGCELQGMVEVIECVGYLINDFEKRPAFLFKINR